MELSAADAHTEARLVCRWVASPMIGRERVGAPRRLRWRPAAKCQTSAPRRRFPSKCKLREAECRLIASDPPPDFEGFFRLVPLGLSLQLDLDPQTHPNMY